MRTRALVLVCAALILPTLALADSHEAGEAAAAATAPTKEWNQEEMTKLSATFFDQMGEVRTAFRRNPTYRDRVASKARAANELMDTLTMLERSARQLRDQVAAGGDRESTTPVARKIGTLLRDANVQGNRLDLSAWTTERIDPAKLTLNAMAPFYGSDPLYDEETMQPVRP